ARVAGRDHGPVHRRPQRAQLRLRQPRGLRLRGQQRGRREALQEAAAAEHQRIILRLRTGRASTSAASVDAMGYRRFVALGDSTTEGLVDIYPDGRFRGWADRLAERLAELEPDLRYANLAVRGKRAHQVREDQLAPSLALRPDL